MIRSLLFVPANADRFVAKAHERGADAIILDLEDGVAPDQKDAARAGLASAAAAVGRNGAQVFVRINPTPGRLEADIAAAHRAGVATLLLPKASLALLQQADGVLGALGSAMQVVPVMEDAAAVLDARAIAAGSARVLGLICGGEDLATSMGAQPTPQTLYWPKMQVHFAAKAVGVLSFGLLRSIADYADAAAIAEAARDARSHGFDGATCVHPSVVPLLNQAFRPGEAELERARRLIAAFEAARAQGQAVCTFEGAMVDEPVVKRARLLVGGA